MSAGTKRDRATVGPYRLVRKLGEGGMGVVYLALDPAGRAVAVKVLRAQVANDDEARRRLAREVSTLRRVVHPRVAEVLDADISGAEPYLVTRFVPGRSLEAEVKDGPLSTGQVARLGRSLADALGAIHAVGVVHRDVKPANVMMVDGEPVLIDFGIAHVADESRITRTGLVMGTPGYLSPELIYGDAVTEATDWWAWGATLAFAATARQPFGTGRIELVLERVRRGQSDLDGIESPLRELLAATLTLDAGRRPNAGQLRSTLEAVIAGVPTLAARLDPAEDPTMRVPPPDRSSGRRASAGPDDRTAFTPPPGRDPGRGAGQGPAHAAPPAAQSAPPWGTSPGGQPARSGQQPAAASYPPPYRPSAPQPQQPPSGQQPWQGAPNPSPPTGYPPQYQQPGYPPGYPAAGYQNPGQPPSGYQQPYQQNPNYPPTPYPTTPYQQPQNHPPTAVQPGTGAGHAAAPAGPRRVTGVLLALTLAVCAVATVAPGGAVVAFLLFGIAARTVHRTTEGLARRRVELGQSRADAAVTAVKLPLRLAMAVLSTVLTSILPGVVAGSMAFIVGTALPRGGAPWPSGPVALAAAGASGLITAWWGPGGTGLRRGGRSILRGVTRGSTGRIVLLAFCALVVVAVAMMLRDTSRLPDWGPFPAPFGHLHALTRSNG